MTNEHDYAYEGITCRPAEQTPMKSQTKEQLAAALRSIAATIEASDSFEGAIRYEATERDMFNVEAFWRVGNSEGQGGSVVI